MISSCCLPQSYMPIMMGGVSVYSSVQLSRYAVARQCNNRLGSSDIGYGTGPTSQHYG